jgi:type I restriction enzyme, R subunit
MQPKSANFEFLKPVDAQLFRLAALAEHYFRADPNTCLLKLRQFAELMARDVGARAGLLAEPDQAQAQLLGALARRGYAPRQALDLFHFLRRAGNEAVHEGRDDFAIALNALKIARQLAVWYVRAYGGQPGLPMGPFTPPPAPPDPSAGLREELDRLRIEAETHRTAAEAERARADALAEATRSAEERAAREAADRQLWQSLAEDAETAASQVRATLRALQARAEATPPQALVTLETAAETAAGQIDLDEAATRLIIDQHLRDAGWEADSAELRHAKGARSAPGRNLAIAEWPTDSGPVDYALFREGQCVGVVEAKRAVTDVPGRLGQAKRYALGIRLTPDETLPGGPWLQGVDQFRVPFLFVTNGRPYVKQLATKSGVWFWDARPGAGDPRALADWFSPQDLKERLEQATLDDDALAERELGVTGLRPYQNEAILAVEAALAAGQRSILLSMATGTGKTRLAIALMYELLRRKRFRRILFLVDRNALGRQTLDAMSTTDTSGFLKFDQVFPVADLARKFPEATDRVQVATVQAMIRRVFDDPDSRRPTPGTYDLIIVDEAHRGYTLDAELREEDLGFRTLEDYLSAYRRVLDYFDATKIALTATPALHTREIFGPPVFRYGYRQAVIDGYLIDHRPPRRITTALSQTGITFEKNDEVSVVDPRTGQIDLFELEDQVDFEIAEFNKKVYTRAFNHAVAEAVARECPPTERGKTLLFAARKDHADILETELRAALAEEYGPQPHDLVETIVGTSDHPLDRIKAFKNDPRPKYVITVDLLTTGIDVPAITNLVFVRRVNSRILYDQMIGRATRRCDEIGKEYFRILDAVDIYANLQDVSDMRPVVVDPALSFATLLGDLARAASDEDRDFVRDQIVVKLRQRIGHIDPGRREALEAVLGPLDDLPDRLKAAPASETLALFQAHPSFVTTLDAANPARSGDGIFISEHEDELVSVDDDFGGRASPADYIESFESFVRANMNAAPALIAATQRPRELTRQELKNLAVLLDANGYSEASLRQAYGRARNADIAAHIIGFVRQAALGDPLVPYETRVENGVQKILASREWTARQKQWLTRIGRALKGQPVGDPEMLADPLFAQAGGFTAIDREFDHTLGEVLKDLNTAIWDPRAA